MAELSKAGTSPEWMMQPSGIENFSIPQINTNGNGGLAGGTYKQNRIGSTDPLQIGTQDALGVGSGTGLPDGGGKLPDGGGGGGFNWGNAMNNFSMGAQGVMGLANAYTAYKQLGLMEDQLNMQKGVANRNIANSAKTTNRMLDDRATMAAQGLGTEYGTQAFRDKKAELQTTVDGSPVA